MCIRAIVQCTDYKELENICEPCQSFLEHEDPFNMGDHIHEVREVPMEGMCSSCSYLKSQLCHSIMAQQGAPEVSVEQELAMFEQMAILANDGSSGNTTDETRNEENSEPVALSAGPSNEVRHEEVDRLSASLSGMGVSEG